MKEYLLKKLLKTQRQLEDTNKLVDRLIDEKETSDNLRIMYRLLSQKLIKLVLESMEEIGWYDTEIFHMCNTLATDEEDFRHLINDVELMLEDIKEVK